MINWKSWLVPAIPFVGLFLALPFLSIGVDWYDGNDVDVVKLGAFAIGLGIFLVTINAWYYFRIRLEGLKQ